MTDRTSSVADAQLAGLTCVVCDGDDGPLVPVAVSGKVGHLYAWEEHAAQVAAREITGVAAMTDLAMLPGVGTDVIATLPPCPEWCDRGHLDLSDGSVEHRHTVLALEMIGEHADEVAEPVTVVVTTLEHVDGACVLRDRPHVEILLGDEDHMPVPVRLTATQARALAPALLSAADVAEDTSTTKGDPS